MSALKSSLQSLAASFAEDVVRAIQGASLQELLGEVAGSRARHAKPAGSNGSAAIADAPAARAPRGPAPLKRGRLKRRSAQDIAATLDGIVSLLKQNSAGLRAEQIRKHLNLLAKELPRPLSEGLEAKVLRKKGQKRATVYFVAGAGAGATSAEAPKVTRKK
jgi:hypothetical protein